MWGNVAASAGAVEMLCILLWCADAAGADAVFAVV